MKRLFISRRAFFIVSISLITLIFHEALAQEDSAVVPFFPVSETKSPLEREIEFEKAIIKNAGFYASLLKYVAVRDEDLSLCDKGDCQKRVKDLLAIRYIGEGRCDEIKRVKSNFAEVCSALKDNTCEKLQGGLNELCKGLKEGNVEYLLQAENKASAGRATSGSSRNNCLTTLAIYSGFKHYSSLACERYLKDSGIPLRSRLSCSVLFSSNANVELESIMRDLAICSLSLKKGQNDLCNLIKNSAIRSTCLKPTKRTLIEMW